MKLEVVSTGEAETDDGTVMYSPRFRIIDGPHTGKSFRVGISMSPQPHERGAIVDGKYDALTGWTLSSRLVAEFVSVSLSLALMGLGTIFFIAPCAYANPKHIFGRTPFIWRK